LLYFNLLDQLLKFYCGIEPQFSMIFVCRRASSWPMPTVEQYKNKPPPSTVALAEASMLTAGVAGLETLELLPIGVLASRPRDLVPFPLGVAIAGHRNAAADDVAVAADELIVVACRRCGLGRGIDDCRICQGPCPDANKAESSGKRK
jgi:hypothetical protein